MRSMGPLVLIGALLLTGCERLVERAVEEAFMTAEGWPRKIAVLVSAFILVALVKWACEGSRESRPEPSDEQDEHRDEDANGKN
jgi:hypothetical protein